MKSTWEFKQPPRGELSPPQSSEIKPTRCLTQLTLFSRPSRNSNKI